MDSKVITPRIRLGKSVSISVNHSVWCSVWGSVDISVSNSVYVSVWSSINDSMIWEIEL